MNPECYADYFLMNLKNNGEYNNLPHYHRLAKFAVRKIGIAPGAKCLEAGAGAGYFTSAISRMSCISSVRALEYSLPMLERVMPAVFTLTRACNKKIERIHGSFLDIHLSDGSLDAVFANCSLHHSHDLGRTLLEVFRVLKVGGALIVLERSHHDDVSEEALRVMLAKEKPLDKARRMYGFTGDRLTRDMLGEHEYRTREWLEYFMCVGFELTFFDAWAPSLYHNPRVAKLKANLVKLLPLSLVGHLFRQYRALSLFILCKPCRH